MEKFLTSQEAAEFLNLDERRLNKLVKEGRLTPYKIGEKFLRYKISEVTELKRELNRGEGFITEANFIREDPAPRLGSISHSLFEKIYDFFYFNDFYIIVTLIIILLILIIIKF